MSRPQRRTIERVVIWLAENGIDLMCQACDPETGTHYGSFMNVSDIDDIMDIYKHNKADDWVDCRD